MYSKNKILYSVICATLLLIIYTLLNNPLLVYKYEYYGIYGYSLILGLFALSTNFLLSSRVDARISLYIIIFSLLIIPKIVSMPLAYDDWTYVGLGMGDLTWTYMLGQFNDHQVPVLRVLIYAIDNIFPPTPLPYLSALALASLFVVYGIKHVLDYFEFDSRSILIALFLFALAPTLITSRQWFGGGFWFTASLGVFLYSIPVVDKFLKLDKFKLKPFVNVIFFLAVLWGLSSQYKLAVFNYLPFLLVYFLKSTKNVRLVLLLVLFISSLSAVQLIKPRLELIIERMNDYGVFGSLEAIFRKLYEVLIAISQWIESTFTSMFVIENASLNISTMGVVPKIGLFETGYLALAMSIFFLVYIYRSYLCSNKVHSIPSYFFLYNFLWFFVIVTMGKGGQQALQGYYQVYPVTIFILFISPIISYFLEFKAFLKPILLLISFQALVVFYYNYRVVGKDLTALQDQLDFLYDYSNAICAEIKYNKGQKIYLNINDYTNKNKKLGYALRAPHPYYKTFNLYRRDLSKSLSRLSCKEESNFIKLTSDQSDITVSDKNSMIKRKEFYQKFEK